MKALILRFDPNRPKTAKRPAPRPEPLPTLSGYPDLPEVLAHLHATIRKLVDVEPSMVYVLDEYARIQLNTFSRQQPRR